MKQVLQDRTKAFALAIIDLTDDFPNKNANSIVATQLIRSATSVGANYRAACRSSSDREFIAKMNSVLEKADESFYWLEIIDEKKWVTIESIAPLLVEADELTAIFVKSLKTINSRL